MKAELQRQAEENMARNRECNAEMRRKLFGKYPPTAPDFRKLAEGAPEGSHERDLLNALAIAKAQGRNPGEQLAQLTTRAQAKSLLDLSTLYTLYVGAGYWNADPLFAQPFDGSLQAGSPCIDAGTAAWTGNACVLSVPAEQCSGQAPDMGAMEYRQ